MKILINASNVTIGGGLTRNLNFIYALSQIKTEHEFILLAPKNVGFENFNRKNLKTDYAPKLLLNRWLKYIHEYCWIYGKIKANKPNVVINMVNICLPFSIKQITMFADPFTALTNFDYLNLSAKEKFIRKLRNWYFRKRLKYTDAAFSQTALIKNKIKEKYSFEKKVFVIGNSFSMLPHENSSSPFVKKNNNQIVLLCFSRFYEHKNLPILIKLAEIIEKSSKNFKILLTISSKQGRKAKKLLKRIQAKKLEKSIINIGKIHYSQIPSLYQNVDGLLLPTLLESYSSTYADAMYHKKPIFTSNLDFAKEICGDCAFYFNPCDESNIFETIKYAFDNPELIKRKTENGYAKIKSEPNWFGICENIFEIIEKLNYG